MEIYFSVAVIEMRSETRHIDKLTQLQLSGKTELFHCKFLKFENAIRYEIVSLSRYHPIKLHVSNVMF